MDTQYRIATATPIHNNQLQYTIHNNQLQYTIHNSQNINNHIKFVPINQLSPQQLFLHQICSQTHGTHIKFLQPTQQISYTQYIKEIKIPQYTVIAQEKSIYNNNNNEEAKS